MLDWDDRLLQELAWMQRSGCEPAIVQRVGDRMQRFLTQTDWVREGTRPPNFNPMNPPQTDPRALLLPPTLSPS